MSESEVQERIMTLTNIRSPKDVVRYNRRDGSANWDITHQDGLKRYLGDNGEKVEIMWEDDDPVFYWGW